MRSSLRFLIVAIAFWPSITLGGGPNDGGTLILHANSSLVYTTDTTEWCGQAGLSACSLAVVDLAADPGVTRVFHALAAFPAGSSPRLKALSFGVEWDDTSFVLVGSGACGTDVFEVPDVGWPASGTGTALS